jgi:uncharacterized damage-inducible protein DinB
MARSTQSSDTAALLQCLAVQREHVFGILDGLDETELRQPVLPSGWTSLGMVKHLALDVERFWFGAVAAGDPVAIDGLAKGDQAWQVSSAVPSGDVFQLYRQEIAQADHIIEASSLDAEPSWWPGDHFDDRRDYTLQKIILHVIAETACHAGHLDAVRELIDGRKWLVLTE